MYIDGYLLPVRPGERERYTAIARKAAEIFRAHGATRVVEAFGDGLEMGEVTSFPRAVKLEEGEEVVFSWIEYPDKATRDRCMEAVMADPFMQENMQTMPVDGRRMVFGGFIPVVDA